MLRRRWFQFSLMSLFCVMLVTGPFLGTWIDYVRERPIRAARSIAILKEHKCFVNCEWVVESGPLARWVGAVPMPHNCEVIAEGNRQLSDEDLRLIGNLEHVRKLSLEGTSVSDAGFRHLRGVRGLQRVLLDDTRIGDAGFSCLNLDEVELLWAAKTLVTDDSVSKIARCKKLTWLRLPGTKITDRGLSEIGQIVQLEQLDISNCQVTNQGIKHTGSLANLTDLVIDHTEITDEGLEAFYRMPKISSIHARGCKISHEAYERLLRSKMESGGLFFQLHEEM